MLALGRSHARKRIDTLLRDTLPAVLNKPVFYAIGGSWRNFARAHIAASQAPVGVVHNYALDTQSARGFAKYLQRVPAAKLKSLPGLAGAPGNPGHTLPAAALVLDCVLKRLKPERVVFSAAGLREGWIYAQLSNHERYLDPLVEGAQLIGMPVARVPGFARALVPWTAQLFPGETPADTRLRVAVCALSDMAWRDQPDLRAKQSYRRLLKFPFFGVDHAERVFVASAIHARYMGRPDAPWLSPALNLLMPDAQRRAQILGSAIGVAYRLSGGVPDVLASFRLRLEADCIFLEVGEDARVPIGEAVGERLQHLAAAMRALLSQRVGLHAEFDAGRAGSAASNPHLRQSAEAIETALLERPAKA